MLRLDHFVVHINNDRKQLKKLKDSIEPLGIPFNPKKGKRTKGFQVSNIWIGDQYFELVWLKRKQSDWKKEWVNRYNHGERGIFCLMLLTDDLDALCKSWLDKGIHVQGPERITFSWLKIFKKKMPFRTLYAPEIPGTAIQIAAIQMDSENYYHLLRTKYMKPNAEKNGMMGIKSAVVSHDFSDEAWEYIHKLFPYTEKKNDTLHYNMGTTSLSFVRGQSEKTFVTLHVHTRKEIGKSFQIENVQVYV